MMGSGFGRPRDACMNAADMFPSLAAQSAAAAAGPNGTGGIDSPNQQPMKRRKLEIDEFSLLNPSYQTHMSRPSLQLSGVAIVGSSVDGAAGSESALFTFLSEDLLLCVCEYFTIHELARLDRVSRLFRTMLNLPPIPSSLSAPSAFSSSFSSSPAASSSDPSAPSPAEEIAALHAHSANYIWRNVALSKSAWPFPKWIDREHLERVVLKHLKKPAAPNPRSVYPSHSPYDTFGSGGGRMSPYHQQHSHAQHRVMTQSPVFTPHPLQTSHITSPDFTSHTLNPFNSASMKLDAPPLNWKAICASLEMRRAQKGTGTLVLDMGSCTVSVGMGGLDAVSSLDTATPTYGLGAATKGTGNAAVAQAAAIAAGVTGTAGTAYNTQELPLSFPAIALNDLVGDQISSQNVTSIDPVSSISMPILHANETGEFSYCSPIWKYALQRIEPEKYAGEFVAQQAKMEREKKRKMMSSSSGGRSSVDIDTDMPDSPLPSSSASISSSSSTSASSASHTSPAASLSVLDSLRAANHAITQASQQIGSDGLGGIVLICDQLLGSKIELAKKRAKVARILFQLQPNANIRLAFCNESFLSLLNTGRTTGVVLHVGFSRSTCAIFVNGRVQNLSSLPTRMVGGHIHSRIMLQALFSRRQFQPAVADMFAVIPLLKEMCYVSLDTQEEQQKSREITHVEITVTEKKLTLGHERFTSSDVFFLYGFPAMVVEALQSSPAWPVLQERFQTLSLQHSNSTGGASVGGNSRTVSPVPMHAYGGVGGPVGQSFTGSNMTGGERAFQLPAAAASSTPMMTKQMPQEMPPAMSIDGREPEEEKAQQVQQPKVLLRQAREKVLSSPSSSSASHHQPVPPAGTVAQGIGALMETYTTMTSTGATYAEAAAAAKPAPVRIPPPAAQTHAPMEDEPQQQQQAFNGSAVHAAASSTLALASASSASSSSSRSPMPQQQQQQQQQQHSRAPTPSSYPPSPAQHPSTPGGSSQAGTASQPGDNEEDEPHQLIKTLLQSIVLSGRSTSLRGFAARFERDLNGILKQNTPAKVHENNVESTWLGGSVLSALSVFPVLAFTREEFIQDGVNAILRHMEL